MGELGIPRWLQRIAELVRGREHGAESGANCLMIENHRTGLIWKTSMSNPEIQPALEAIGFHKDCVALASRKDDLFCRSKVREASFPDLSHHANIPVGHFGDLVLDRSAQN